VIKLSLDKLEIKEGFKTIENFLSDNDFEILSIDLSDTKVLLTLEHFHKDPFDRVIISQAISSNLRIVTKDNRFKSNPIDIIW